MTCHFLSQLTVFSKPEKILNLSLVKIAFLSKRQIHVPVADSLLLPPLG